MNYYNFKGLDKLPVEVLDTYFYELQKVIAEKKSVMKYLLKTFITNQDYAMISFTANDIRSLTGQRKLLRDVYKDLARLCDKENYK